MHLPLEMPCYIFNCTASYAQIFILCAELSVLLTWRALGVGAIHEVRGGGHKVAPPYFSRNISATRKRPMQVYLFIMKSQSASFLVTITLFLIYKTWRRHICSDDKKLISSA